MIFRIRPWQKHTSPQRFVVVGMERNEEIHADPPASGPNQGDSFRLGPRVAPVEQATRTFKRVQKPIEAVGFDVHGEVRIVGHPGNTVRAQRQRAADRVRDIVFLESIGEPRGDNRRIVERWAQRAPGEAKRE